VAVALASVLLMADAAVPSKTSGIVISVSDDGTVTATKDGRGITCGQLRALFYRPHMPRKLQLSCKQFRKMTDDINRHYGNN
jgi:hypothetical protein